MQLFRDVLRWYNNKHVVSTLGAMKKKWFSFLTITGLTCWSWVVRFQTSETCRYSSTSLNFYPFLDRDNELLEKYREDVVGAPWIVFTRKVVLGEIILRSSSKDCKSIMGVDASQFYPYATCQPMPTGLYTRWVFDGD